MDWMTDCVKPSNDRTMSLNVNAASPRSMLAPAAVAKRSLGPLDISPPVAGPTNVLHVGKLQEQIDDLHQLADVTLDLDVSARLETARPDPMPSRYQILYADVLPRS